MDRVFSAKDEYTCYADCGLVDRVLEWLEREDGELDRIIGYGFCLAAVTYFVARLAQALMRW